MVTAVCRSAARWRPWFPTGRWLVAVTVVAATGRASALALAAGALVVAASLPFRRPDCVLPRAAGSMELR